MAIDLTTIDIDKMRDSYIFGAPAWTDDEVYADYTTYIGHAIKKQECTLDSKPNVANS